jgi:hypothetical protein
MSLTDIFKRLINVAPDAALETPAHRITVTKRPATNPWHAVGITPGRNACAIARGESETRYLSREAPPLPLKDCDSDTCTCRYHHFDDRRASLRRAADVWSNNGMFNGPERRRAGRRSTDAPRV